MTDSSSSAMLTRELANPWSPPSTHPRPWRLSSTIRDRIAGELRHRILLGSLPAGVRIDLDALAEEFGTSRTPVREACLELANDNLVRLTPRTGITVLGITDSDLLDNFELMAALAGMAAFWAAARADDGERKAISDHRHAVVDAIDSGGDAALANFLFHRQINLASHSSRAISSIAQTARLFPERFLDVIPSQIPCSLRDHDELVEAISARDGATARQVMEEHFHQAADRLRDHLSIPDARS